MDKLLGNLKKALEQAVKEEDLPDYIAKKVNIVVENFKSYSEKRNLIEELTERLEYYDAFGNAGCFNISYSAEDIETVLKDILN